MENSGINTKSDKLLLKHSLLFPFFFLCLIWFIKIIELLFDADFSNWGIYPRHIESLKGILSSPLLHSNLSHLIANSFPVFLLSWGIFFFYRTLAYRIFFLSWLFSGLLLWILGRNGYHIGASGLVYAFAAFLFLSGILRSYGKLIAISLIVVFLYGSLFWGVFPIMKDISWEGHLLGAAVGFTLAFFYRKKGPQAPEPKWDDEDEEDDKSIIPDPWNVEE